jgi:hypothetical protein
MNGLLSSARPRIAQPIDHAGALAAVDVAHDVEELLLTLSGFGACVSAQVGALEHIEKRRAVFVLLAEIVEERREHDFPHRDAQRLERVGRARRLFLCGAPVDVQSQLPGQGHHPEVRTIFALEERCCVRPPVYDDVLFTRVAREDILGEGVDIDVGLDEVWEIAAPPCVHRRPHGYLVRFQIRAKLM